MGDIRDIRQSAESVAKSAASSARSNAATARSTQTAATGIWVGAGFQAVNMIQGARAARAQQEQLAMHHAMTEQSQQQHQFAMWRQTPHGVAFVQWRDRAFRLAQFIRDRDSEWQQGWARTIGRAQAEIPAEEKQRFANEATRLKQPGLLAVAITVSSLFGVLALFGMPYILMFFVAAVGMQFNPEAAISPGAGFGSSAAEVRLGSALILLVLLLVVGIPVVVTVLLWRRYQKKRRAARGDRTVPNEAQARIDRWQFDPLLVQPGFAAYGWCATGDPSSFADQLMHLVQFGGEMQLVPEQLIPLVNLPSWPPSPNYPVEINEVLTRFQMERPVLS